MLFNIANKVAGRFGYKLKIEKSNSPFDILGNAEFMGLYNECKPYTMTSLERMFSLYQSVSYIIKNNIEGDLVECGVWRGGSSMMISLMLKRNNITDRKIYLYDTFEGMSEPSDFDTTARGVHANELMKKEKKDDEKSVWCYAPLEDVKKHLYSTGYPENNLIFIKGKIEDTLSSNMPGKLSLLRLDTDWYESTKIELELLFPLLNEKGVLIIDDFGHWDGARKAVTEYFEKTNKHPLLHRIDYTGRLMIK
jgi:O-methyltransferase